MCVCIYIHTYSPPATAPPPPPPASSLLDLILLRSSMDYFMVSNPIGDVTTSSALLLHSSSTSCIITKEYSHHVKDLIHTLKYLFNQALITIQVATQQEVDPTTTLATLQSLMAAISLSTHHSSECIAETALEDLRQLSLLSRQLQKKLAKYNSTASYISIITSTIGVAGAAACAGAVPPPALIQAVQQLPQLVSTVWKERMIDPLEGKLKVVEANRFMIYCTIIKVMTKIKDMVQGLLSLVAYNCDDGDAEHHEKKKKKEKVLEELKKALMEALAQLQLVELELEIEK